MVNLLHVFANTLKEYAKVCICMWPYNCTTVACYVAVFIVVRRLLLSGSLSVCKVKILFMQICPCKQSVHKQVKKYVFVCLCTLY